jgi:RNA polymerase sigma factor (sigma-70 family)
MRRTCERGRRTILSGDLDRLSWQRRLWGEPQASREDDREALVRAAVATALTDKQREVVEAHFFEGLSQGEIARRLGITQQVVHKRLYGAIRDGQIVGGAMRRLRDALARGR